MADMINYTRSYTSERESWQPALEYLQKANNLLASNKAEFEKEYIIKEIDNLADNLEELLKMSRYDLGKFIRKSREAGQLITLRNISRDESRIFDAYPEDFAFTFKVEKILGASCFLKNMKELLEVTAFKSNGIRKVIQLNKELEPDTLKNISKYKKILSKRQITEDKLKSRVDDIETKLEPYEKERDELLAKEGWQNYLKISQQYSKEHPEYETLLEALRDARAEYNEFVRVSNRLRNFKSTLESKLSDSKKYIHEFLKMEQEIKKPESVPAKPES
jgi:hypothetical protein